MMRASRPEKASVVPLLDRFGHDAARRKWLLEPWIVQARVGRPCQTPAAHRPQADWSRLEPRQSRRLPGCRFGEASKPRRGKSDKGPYRPSLSRVALGSRSGRDRVAAPSA